MATPTPDLPWLAALEDPAAYPHPAEDLRVLHTHLSVVALAGEFAYKLKKPVNYGFVDFSTLDKRRFFCEEELRLNARTAPALYLDVAVLRKTPAGWRFAARDGNEASAPAGTLEYAVRMRRFADGERLDRLAERGLVTEARIEDLAAQVAALHARSAVAQGERARSYAQRLAKAIENNFKALPGTERERLLRRLFDERLAAEAPLLERRGGEGRVRECHGDLHLANICLWEGRPQLFDGIEFSEDLRWIDVLSDAAFLYMDLEDRGLYAGAQRFLNAYLETTGDYGGLGAWPLFVAYRAHVRAKIAQLTLHAPGVPAAEAARQEAVRDRYLKLAAESLAFTRGGLVMMAGLPGSGKSTVALKIACAERGVRVRSDVERRRLHAAEPNLERYGPELGARTYARLLDCARAAVEGGQTAVLDATYTRRAHRKPVLDLAKELGVRLRIVHCDVPMDELVERVRRRAAEGKDPSEADEAVLRQMAGSWEPFSDAELPLVRKS